MALFQIIVVITVSLAQSIAGLSRGFHQRDSGFDAGNPDEIAERTEVESFADRPFDLEANAFPRCASAVGDDPQLSGGVVHHVGAAPAEGKTLDDRSANSHLVIAITRGI